MGWVQEIADLVGKLSFFSIVHEWEDGLYVRGGLVIKKPIRLSGKSLEKIANEEAQIARDSGGRVKLFFNRKKEFPQGYRRSFAGQPIHPKRYERDEVLRPGLYFNIPIYDDIIVRSKQEKPIDLGSIGVPTTDDENIEVQVSCNIRYELKDLYKAFTVVFDYEDSLKIHALSILARCSRGKTYKEWKQPEVIDKLQVEVVNQLKKIVTKEWGLEIKDFTITTNVRSQFTSTYLDTNSKPIQVVLEGYKAS